MDVRAKHPNEPRWAVFLEDDDVIDSTCRPNDGNAICLTVDRPVRSVEPAHAAIAVAPNHEHFAELICSMQELDMPSMENIEYPVGEDDRASRVSFHVGSTQEAGAPLLAEQRCKFVLLFRLRSFGRTGNAQAIPLLRWALQSEDRGVRLAATQSLARFSGSDVDADLRSLLADPANRV